MALTTAGLEETGSRLQQELRAFKARTALPDYGWYPYESLSALAVVGGLIAPFHGELDEALGAAPVADLGCGDGEWSVLFAQLGAQVDAIDHRESNFNQMRGLDVLRRTLAPSIGAFDIDLDARIELPRRDYGLILFLGTLYHLKNPYHVLETLAAAGDWCILSTRIAQVAPHTRVRIDTEPLAYLLDRREANNDPTNFWIFSPAGLARLLERTGWQIAAEKRVGCAVDSDPVDPAADERAFLLLRSRARHPELLVRPLAGWHGVEDGWRWTAKRFSLEVALPTAQSTAEFALRFTVPDVVLASGAPVRLFCRCGNALLGSISCDAPETIEFRGRFPRETPPGAVLRLEFEVESSYQAPGDARDLGVIVPLAAAAQRNTERIPFRIS
jgi:2-polyprenyl-3-methyl-5-hydroxy-6-metoxy-1,4-benzoquinol methylase